MTPQQRSSLVILGEHVLTWNSDYRTLVDLFRQVALAHRSQFPAKTRFQLDFEYKKIQPGHLIIKQVRELPLPDTGPVYLVGESVEYHSFPWGAFLSTDSGDDLVDQTFAAHANKSRWTLSTPSMMLTGTNRLANPIAEISVEYVDGSEIKRLTGPPSSFPNAVYSRETFWGGAVEAVNRFSLGIGEQQRHVELRLLALDRVGGWPLLRLLSDVHVWIHGIARFDPPLPAFGYRTDTAGNRVFGPGFITEADHRLTTSLDRGCLCPLRQRRFEEDGVVIETSHDSAPVETRITGLTAEPIVLRDYFSQTLGRSHHHVLGTFIFEPRIEPGLPTAQVQELEQRNIRLLYVVTAEAFQSCGNPASAPDLLVAFQIMGLDGHWRAAP